MKVTEITVNAGRTLQHPCESYANIRPSVTLKAELQDGEPYADSVKTLQINAERLVEEHAAVLISSLQQRQVSEQEASEIRRLESALHHDTQRLEELRERADSRTPDWLDQPQIEE